MRQSVFELTVICEGKKMETAGCRVDLRCTTTAVSQTRENEYVRLGWLGEDRRKGGWDVYQGDYEGQSGGQ